MDLSTRDDKNVTGIGRVYSLARRKRDKRDVALVNPLFLRTRDPALRLHLNRGRALIDLDNPSMVLCSSTRFELHKLVQPIPVRAKFLCGKTAAT